MDDRDNTTVFWHCGLAPISMAEKNTPSATVHSNRRKPLLHNFALKSGDITIFRVSKSENNTESEQKFREAKKLERQGMINQSEKILVKIFNSFPSNEKYFNAIKKIYIKKEDCLSLMEITEKYSIAKKNDIYSKIQQIESSIICYAEWEKSLNNLIQDNIENTRFMKKIISMLLKNNEDQLAISTVNKKREFGNDSFFALELGYYYLSLKDYEKSLIEYLKHLNKFPKQLEMINQRVVSFTDDIATNNTLILILKKSDSIESKIILSDLYFKINKPEESIKVLKEFNLYSELFSLAINLDMLKDGKLSQEILLYIIAYSQNELIIEKSIYELGRVLEKRSSMKKINFPISNFMNENKFFNSPFIKTNGQDSISLYKAKRMYDSIDIKGNNLKSRFRTAEIDFKIFQYLDESLKSYKYINKNTRDRDMKLKAINRIADVLIAKGDLESAINLVDEEILKEEWNDNEKIFLQIKLNQILFYQADIDLVFENLNLILNKFSSNENIYNDILSTLGVLLILKEEDIDTYKKYTIAQHKINQNKRIESIGILNSILEDCKKDICKNELTIDLVRYQIANLLIQQNKPNDAIEILKKIEGDGIYTELAIIFLAEIFDYLKNDKNTATEYYLSILKDYPQSIYYESIRKRVRSLLEEV